MQPAPQRSALGDTPQASELQTARGTLRLGPFVTQQRELKRVQILAEQLCWAPGWFLHISWVILIRTGTRGQLQPTAGAGRGPGWPGRPRLQRQHRRGRRRLRQQQQEEGDDGVPSGQTEVLRTLTHVYFEKLCQILDLPGPFNV